MAQEQAKSETAAAGAEEQAQKPLDAMTRRRSESGEGLERGLELPKRTSLAERLKAEQRKREAAAEPKREEPPLPKTPEEPAKPPLEFSEAAASVQPASTSATPRQFTRTKRPAGPPPQRRIAAPANDDVPSIGGLIFALQQRPSKTPFLIAAAASVAWFLIGGLLAFGLISSQVSTAGVSGLFGSASALSAVAAILLPIIIFWFLALLVWRAQELRLMASAMTEVAVRLAEPDRLAEQSVASVGQTIRRQVAAMNDAISRAIGRASELEAMVHSEVAALERSYGENEIRVRGLISELATERDALANNSSRVSEALKGVGAQVARDIANASSAIDKKLAERGVQLTELLVARSSEAAEQVQKAQARVVEAVPGLLERLGKEQGRLTQVIEGATQNLAALETVVAQRTTALDKTMKERTESLQSSLAARIKGLEDTVAQGAILLDNTVKGRTDAFALAITQNAAGLDKAFKDRTEAFTTLVSQGAVLMDNTLKQRTEELTLTIGQGAEALDKTLKDRTEGFVAAVGQGAGIIDKAVKDRTEGLTGLLSQGAVVLDRTLAERTAALATSIGEGAAKLDKAINERSGQLEKSLYDRTAHFNAMIDQKAALLERALQDRTGQFIAAITGGTSALDRTLQERAENFTSSLLGRVQALETAITQQTSSLDKTMMERAQAVIMALSERLKAIDATFSGRAAETDRMLGEHARATAEAFGKQTSQLNQVLANNASLMQQTANQVGAQSKEAVGILTSQTQTLREVSRNLLDQIHGLTQRFESQGQAILTAAKALDSSNTKIDSILEGRHQAIIALLHTVNTKAQDLDNMMRSYAGMVENAMNQAEARAKQVGTALTRDTAGQAQAALQQIERLREEAQAHTQRAVGQLKTSFESVINQIGQQLEQMRGQFDNTSRGMREAAQKTATDLDSLRQEMQKRMETLPEHTAQTTAAIRKALNDQLKEIEAITTPTISRPAAPPPVAEPFRPAPQAPLPHFDARGRQAYSPEGDMGQVAGGLAQQLAGAAPRPPAQAGGGQWSVGDLLSRASAEPDHGYGGQNFGTRPNPPAQGGGLRLDEIARAIDYRGAADVWQRLRGGERGVLGRHIYSSDGQATFDEVSRRYDREPDFRATVDRYINDFERLLGEAEASDPQGNMLQNYLTSESGRVYLLLAHASGRLR
jgi:hypothetical protein